MKKEIKDLKRQILRIFSRFKWLIFSVLTMLVIINTLLAPISSNAQSSSNSYTATFDAVNGDVQIFPAGDTSSSQTPTPNETTIRGIDSKRPDILWVAGTRPNSEYESWAHLRLWQGDTAVDPILQAGTDSTDTEYTFPCGVAITGSIVTGWGLRQESPWGCENIDLKHPDWKGSDLSNPYLTEKSGTKKFHRKTEIAQNSSSKNRVRISKDKDLTLVYAHNLDGDLAIDVLVGAIKVQTANNQSQSVQAGTRYVYFGSTKPETTININPSEIAKLRPVQIFLDSTKWGKDAKPLIERFREILVPDPLPPIAQEILDAHNKCRAKVNVPPLRWSSQLATYAQEWTDKLSSTGGFEHRQNNIYGENLAGGDLSPTDAVNMWCGEEEKYNPETGQCRDGVCGHYTQVVWKKTTQLGCGVSSHSRWGKVWVCNYNPPGNFIGEKPY
jgi:uncharacterized protein YkwD